MGSLGNPKAWVPYMNSKDCSQGFCSLYCPQWCYMIFPPPPPIQFPEDNSNTKFSPLVIAIIGILASAFLLVSYYTIISKYCGNADSARREIHDQEAEQEDNHNPSLHEPWHVAPAGLDEALIKSITVLKYKKRDGLVEGTDCSVCLSEFEEDESLRLLPKCSHAFHLPCIDTWLKSHSNCPLCRANIVIITPPQPKLILPVIETPPAIVQEQVMHSNGVSDVGNFSEGRRDTIIEIRSDEEDQQMRRSVSMNCLCESRVSVADILCISEGEVDVEGSSNKQASEEFLKGSNVNKVAMRRSFSSGRLFLTRHGCRVGKGKAIVPV